MFFSALFGDSNWFVQFLKSWFKNVFFCFIWRFKLTRFLKVGIKNVLFCLDLPNRLNGSCRVKPIARHVEGKSFKVILSQLGVPAFFLESTGCSIEHDGSKTMWRSSLMFDKFCSDFDNFGFVLAKFQSELNF